LAPARRVVGVGLLPSGGLIERQPLDAGHAADPYVDPGTDEPAPLHPRSAVALP
jgi:hypothetical protein